LELETSKANSGRVMSGSRQQRLIPPTAVGGWFRSSLGTQQRKRLRNPTNGSWWMVQVRTIYVVRGEQALGTRTMNSLDLNEPPTTRWWDSGILVDDYGRKDLNHPPTTVGGILTFCARHPRHQSQSTLQTKPHDCARLPPSL